MYIDMNKSNTVYPYDFKTELLKKSDKLYIKKLMYMKTIKIIVDNNDLSIKKHISMAQYKNTT